MICLLFSICLTVLWLCIFEVLLRWQIQELFMKKLFIHTQKHCYLRFRLLIFMLRRNGRFWRVKFPVRYINRQDVRSITVVHSVWKFVRKKDLCLQKREKMDIWLHVIYMMVNNKCMTGEN